MILEYIKTLWQSKITPLSADNMNHIEDGIEAITNGVNEHLADNVQEFQKTRIRTYMEV